MRSMYVKLTWEYVLQGFKLYVMRIKLNKLMSSSIAHNKTFNNNIFRLNNSINTCINKLYNMEKVLA